MTKKKVEVTKWIENQLIKGKDYVEKIPFGGGYGIYFSKNNVLVFFDKRSDLVKLKKLLTEFLKKVN